MDTLNSTPSLATQTNRDDVFTTPLWLDRLAEHKGNHRDGIQPLVGIAPKGFKIIRNERDPRDVSCADWEDSIQRPAAFGKNAERLLLATKQGITVIQSKLDELLMNFHGDNANYALSLTSEDRVQVKGDPMLVSYLSAKIEVCETLGSLSLTEKICHLRDVSIAGYHCDLANKHSTFSPDTAFGYEVVVGYGFIKLWNWQLATLN